MMTATRRSIDQPILDFVLELLHDILEICQKTMRLDIWALCSKELVALTVTRRGLGSLNAFGHYRKPAQYLRALIMFPSGLENHSHSSLDIYWKALLYSSLEQHLRSLPCFKSRLDRQHVAANYVYEQDLCHTHDRQPHLL